MSRSLPSKPNITQLKNQAKDILKAHRTGDKNISDVLKKLNRFKSYSDDKILSEDLALHEAQFALAIDYGFTSWDAMIKHVRATNPTKQPIDSYSNGNKVIIANIPKLSWEHSGATTYAGALTAALSVTEKPVSYSDIMGYSGLAFRIRWYRRTDTPEWCFSSPTGEFPEELKATQANTGWQFDINDRLYLDDDEINSLHEKIILSIDKGIPAIGHPDDLDVAVLYGYERDGDNLYFLWDSYNSGQTFRLPENKIERMIIIPTIYNNETDIRKSVINALTLKSWRQSSWIPPNYPEVREHSYLFGQLALKTWAEDISLADGFTTTQRDLLHKVSNWCFSALFDSRQQAAIFLNDHAGRFEPEVAAYLENAAAIYENLVRILNEAYTGNSLFGKNTADNWTFQIREQESQLLKTTIEYDSKAIAEIDKALEAYGVLSK